jgi:hypothetical protein
MTNRLAPQKNTEHHAADKDCHNEHGCQESSKIIGHVYIIPVYVGASTDFSRNPKDPGRAALCPSLFTVALKMKFSKGTIIKLDGLITRPSRYKPPKTSSTTSRKGSAPVGADGERYGHRGHHAFHLRVTRHHAIGHC